MIDIHSHILPGIDDGAASLDESIAMAKAAVQDGISVIVATPHAWDGNYNCRIQDIQKACDQLNIRLEQEQIPVKIRPGSEVRLCPELLELIADNQVQLLNNGPYLLLELPQQFIAQSVHRMIKALRLRGIIPIIAHPERNLQIMGSPDIAGKLIFSGAMMQITAASIWGGFGKKALQTARVLLESDYVHFMATDAHKTSDQEGALSRGMNQLKKLARKHHRRVWELNPEKIFIKHS